jgi:hypothetical protein
MIPISGKEIDISWENVMKYKMLPQEKWPGQLRTVPIGFNPRFYMIPRNPLTEEQYLEIANEYGPQYAIAIEIVSDEIKKGNSIDDSIKEALRRVENVDESKLRELVDKFEISIKVEGEKMT